MVPPTLKGKIIYLVFVLFAVINMSSCLSILSLTPYQRSSSVWQWSFHAQYIQGTLKADAAGSTPPCPPALPGGERIVSCVITNIQPGDK